MPAKWQTWMPRQIDAWHGSTFVQFSDPAARSGYADLLDKQWQSDDCTIPDDAQELSELSGLGASLWEIHGPRILKKFVLVEPGKRRNQVCYQLWLEAKRVYESRQKSALETNRKRTERAEARRLRHGDRAVTATPSLHRNRDTVEVQKQIPHPQPPLAARGLGSPIGPSQVPTQPPRPADPARFAAQAKENNGRKSRNGAPGPREKKGDGIGRRNSGGGVDVAQRPAAVDVVNGAHQRNRRASAGEMKAEILAYWAAQNPESPQCPWGAAADRAVDALRAGNVELSIEQFKGLLQARAASEGINPAALPHKWLRDLMQWSSGPLDRYKHPLRTARHL